MRIREPKTRHVELIVIDGPGVDGEEISAELPVVSPGKGGDEDKEGDREKDRELNPIGPLTRNGIGKSNAAILRWSALVIRFESKGNRGGSSLFLFS